jgi:uncharacterized protein (DUF736 family)
MAFEQRDNEGALFRNDKEGNDKRPDYKGSLKAAGVTYKISAWVNTPKAGGDKFLKLKLEPADEARPAGSVPAATGEAKPLEDLPF